MKVKFCGITNRTDAMNAIALNIDALGFIFYEQSPRYISIEKVEEILLDLPPFIHVIGVFVNASVDFINEATKRCRLTGIQLHGQESPEFCLKFHLPVIKAIPVKNKEDIYCIPQYKGCVNGILLDTKAQNVHGGTGKTFDWGLAIEAKAYDVPLILSGGINATNISKAIKMVSPYGIDICSGLEKEPGIKDYNKMKLLLDAIQTT
ncbi:MAG: phosphoribosylanthranilate isomerase [Candidatus Margulisbacteria bacterium]|nr:phosphoribosylanthranilate isomerase [Candidatus Margulisiibacteriota bacterium]